MHIPDSGSDLLAHAEQVARLFLYERSEIQACAAICLRSTDEAVFLIKRVRRILLRKWYATTGSGDKSAFQSYTAALGRFDKCFPSRDREAWPV